MGLSIPDQLDRPIDELMAEACGGNVGSLTILMRIAKNYEHIVVKSFCAQIITTKTESTALHRLHKKFGFDLGITTSYLTQWLHTDKPLQEGIDD